MLIHAKNVKDQETHSLSFYSSHLYIYILLLHRNVDDADDAIMQRMKKKKIITCKKNEKKREREETTKKKKEKHVRIKYSHTNMSDPSLVETDMLIVPIMILSRRRHLGIFFVLEISNQRSSSSK